MASGSTNPNQQSEGTTVYYEDKNVAGYMALVAAVQILTNGETGGGSTGNLTATLQHSLNGGSVDSHWEDLEEIGQWAYNATVPDTKVKFYPQPAETGKEGFMQYVRIKVVTDASSGTWELIAHIEAKGQ